jgi:hypothetical protein
LFNSFTFHFPYNHPDRAGNSRRENTPLPSISAIEVSHIQFNRLTILTRNPDTSSSGVRADAHIASLADQQLPFQSILGLPLRSPTQNLHPPKLRFLNNVFRNSLQGPDNLLRERRPQLAGSAGS